MKRFSLAPSASTTVFMWPEGQPALRQGAKRRYIKARPSGHNCLPSTVAVFTLAQPDAIIAVAKSTQSTFFIICPPYLVPTALQTSRPVVYTRAAEESLSCWTICLNLIFAPFRPTR